MKPAAWGKGCAMDIRQMLVHFWADVAEQNAQGLKTYFLPDALIRWHNTNECFTVSEYIIANCEYPGDWCGEVQRIELLCDGAVSVARVWPADGGTSFHATSFFKLQDGKIAALDEYWSEDETPPQWRLQKHLGKAIK